MAQQFHIPPGYVRCETCGEYNGTTDPKNLSWPNRDVPDHPVSVTCICHGIPCRTCGENLIHRPISNEYDPASNEVWHMPYFGGMVPCRACREKKERGNP